MPPDEILKALSPILDSTMTRDRLRVSMNQYDVAGLVAFTTHQGFKYSVDNVKVSVGFEHILRPKAVSAGPPVMEMLSTPKPYTELLLEVGRRLKEALLLLEEIKSRSVHRVGIVSITKLAMQDLPPGLLKFVRYLGRPWKHEIANFSYRVVAALSRNPETFDRCIYQIATPEDDLPDDELLTLLFDWQRNFTKAQSIATIDNMIQSAETSALSYFEELAEGNQFDEELIRGNG
jgi:hypothetical protein